MTTDATSPKFEQEPAALTTARRGDARAEMLRSITEADWHGYIVSLAALFKWRHYHTYDSRRSSAGFPDLVLVRGTRVIFAELKAETGRITKAQQDWVDEIEVGAAVSNGALEVYVWRPSDREEVERVLA